MGFDGVAWGTDLEDFSNFDWVRTFPLTVEVGDNWSIVSGNDWVAGVAYIRESALGSRKSSSLNRVSFDLATELSHPKHKSPTACGCFLHWTHGCA